MPTIPIETIATLAPSILPNRRSRRYAGDDVYSKLSDFAPADQAIVRRLYAFLQELFERLNPDAVGNGRMTPELRAFLAHLDVDDWVSTARAFGSASHDGSPSAQLAKTIHDVRGGGLTSILGYLALMAMDGGRKVDGLSGLFFLTRDHLKIIRNAIVGLDDEKRAEDLLPKLHTIGLIVEKWDGAMFGPADGQVRVAVDHRYDGPIAECCVEFGALDRILYNLMNNAVRHAAEKEVRLFVLPLPDKSEPENLRFALSNSVGDADIAKLRQMGDLHDLRQLFVSGVSTTASGLGLTIVADFVCNAYGIVGRDDAFQQGYLGACVKDGNFIVWFHWPMSHGI